MTGRRPTRDEAIEAAAQVFAEILEKMRRDGRWPTQESEIDVSQEQQDGEDDRVDEQEPG